MRSIERCRFCRHNTHCKKRVDALARAIEALQRQLAAKGLLHSGAMLKQVLGLCKDALQEHGTVVSAEYRWAITNALLASQSWVEQLVSDAIASFAELFDACARHIARAVGVAGGPDLAARLLGELEAKRASVEGDVALALRSAFAEKRRGLLLSFT